jgi:hypothetical protein
VQERKQHSENLDSFAAELYKTMKDTFSENGIKIESVKATWHAGDEEESLVPASLFASQRFKDFLGLKEGNPPATHTLPSEPDAQAALAAFDAAAAAAEAA